ncbi:hypothetical protein F1188_04365 [Roseospira marina]|uniref:Uncharacterized protein n=1 Tax=Roseospira marina TaxID=140057 RepID=A0A5M6IFR5_9PROT|nr:hypothetical protein [Roseospira marina]KAA5607141.1 hypothetical protein F1188_04365 [Roseospira marina]MBB4312659.1 hypothetical protein [Roseospira marina]MBB5086568.1 hypothetical protein [Roseospira marina]
MGLRARNRVIQAALEDLGYAQGVADPADYVAILAVSADLPSIQGQTAERQTVEPHMGSRPGQLWQERAPLNWGVETVGSGDVAVPPVFDVLLRAAGWSRVQLTGTATVAAAPVAVGAPTGSWTYTVETGFTGLNRRRVTISCTTAGGSGTAVATIAAPAVGLGETAEAAYEVTGVAITDATAITLPGGAEITPTIGADWDIGDQWVVELVPPGIEYWPSSDRVQPSAIVQYNMDGTLFTIPGARWQLNYDATVGQWPLVNLRGMGLWKPPAAAPIGTPDYSTIREPEVLDYAAFDLFIGPADLSDAEWEPSGQSRTLSGGADVRSKSRTNLDTVEISNHALTGEVRFDCPAIDDVNVWVWPGVRRRIRSVTGTRLGERCEVVERNAQILGVTTREDGEDVMTTLRTSSLPVSGGGDDEVCIRFF